MKKQIPKTEKEKELHLTRPPRLEGKVKNARTGSKRGKKKPRARTATRKTRTNS